VKAAGRSVSLPRHDRTTTLTRASRAGDDEMMRRLSNRDVTYLVCVACLAVATVLPWWLSDMLPLMDYPMFLSFVRVFQDFRDPASPLSPHFTLGPLLSPLLLPMILTSALSMLGSVELGGRLMLSLYSLGMLASAAYLLRALGRSRWNVLLVAPLVFGKSVSSGFVGFFTAVPLLLCCTALAVRHLQTPSRARAVGIAVSLAGIHLWHAIIFGEALLTLGVLWLCWRAPSWRSRLRVLLLAAPAAALFAVWLLRTISTSAGGRLAGMAFDPFTRILDPMQFFGCIPMRFTGAEQWVFGALLVLIACRALFGGAPAEPNVTFRVSNPAALLAVITLASYVFAPVNIFGNEIFNYRFAWIAALWGALAWSLPGHQPARLCQLTILAVCAAAWFVEINLRFTQFHQETVGASRLIDSIGKHETLFAPMIDSDTRAFINKPLREVQQYATIRHGSLPNTSFATYNINIIRFKTKENPLPVVPASGWETNPRLLRFDYVLLRDAARSLVLDSRLRFLRRDGRWSLFAVRKTGPGSHG
jgi:hypothetical protein